MTTRDQLKLAEALRDATRALMFAEDWRPYTGPHGGKGWVNAAGEVRYQDDEPGAGDSPASSQNRPAPAPVRYPKGFAPPQPNAPGRHANRANPFAPDETRPALSLDQAKALFLYTGTRVAPQLNRALRAGQGPPSVGLLSRAIGRPDPTRVHAALQAAFAAAPVRSTPFRVQRALTVDDPNGFAAWAEANKGRLISLPGYQSTSAADPAKGDTFGTKGQYSGNIVLHVRAVHGLDAKPYSRFPGEEEVLLNHGQRYRVERVERRPDAVHIELTQLPPVAAAVSRHAEAPADLGQWEPYPTPAARAADLATGQEEAAAILRCGSRMPSAAELEWLRRARAPGPGR